MNIGMLSTNSIRLHNGIALKSKISKFFKQIYIILICNFFVATLIFLDLFTVISTLDIDLVKPEWSLCDLALALVHHYLRQCVAVLICCFLYRKKMWILKNICWYKSQLIVKHKTDGETYNHSIRLIVHCLHFVICSSQKMLLG